jgi:pimeloyl-ACP methyl ester carboxylesterase
MNLVFIHGHRATSLSFNFLAEKLHRYRQIFLDYNSEDGFEGSHQKLLQHLQEVDDIFFIAHSLGGIHAMHLADELGDSVLGGVTISTPYGGSEAAQVLAYMMPFNKVYKDIRPTSAPIIKSTQIGAPKIWTNIVTVSGHTPLMAAPNDGVVTQASMRNRTDIQLVEVDSNHFEVLMHPKTISTIRTAIRKVEASRVVRQINFG